MVVVARRGIIASKRLHKLEAQRDSAVFDQRLEPSSEAREPCVISLSASGTIVELNCKAMPHVVCGLVLQAWVQATELPNFPRTSTLEFKCNVISSSELHGEKDARGISFFSRED